MKKPARLFLLSLLFPIAALVLEALPFGVVLHFGQPDGESIASYYSHFSLVPFGYANFGPLLTAILTCLLTAAVMIPFLMQKAPPRFAALLLSAAAVVTSLMPLMFGIRYLTPIGLGVTLLLGAEFVSLLLAKKQS